MQSRGVIVVTDRGGALGRPLVPFRREELAVDHMVDARRSPQAQMVEARRKGHGRGDLGVVGGRSNPPQTKNPWREDRLLSLSKNTCRKSNEKI